MFKKLQRRLVLINVAVTTIILFLAFVTIFLVMQNSSAKRPLPPDEPGFSPVENKNMDNHIRNDRQVAMRELLWLLLALGLVIEGFVVLISYKYAEIAIRPVQEAYEKQKLFITNASHEIKTPLAAISANLEAAAISDNHWINNIGTEVQKLNTLNQELLDLVKVESMKMTPQTKELAKVASIIQEVAATFEAQAKAKNLKVKLDLRKKTTKLNLNVKDLQQVLAILLDNAIKYGKKNISIDYDGKNIITTNDGASIPKEKLKLVFDRFYQVDKSSEGSGLGLAIAKAVADNNNWGLSVKSERGKTSFYLSLC